MIRCYQLFDPARVLVAAEVDSTLRTKFNSGVVLSNDTSTPISGLIRWNGSVFQGYNGSAWETFGTAENVVELQGSSPGTPQTGHANLSGVIIAGGFSGPLTGNVSGDCSGSSGSCTGNAATATKWGSYAGITGPSTARTFTLPDADATLLYSGGALGTPASGTLTNCTFPTLNQDTTGSAAYWKTSGTGKAGISGPGTGQTRTYTYPDQDATILYSGGALGTPASGTLTNCTFPTLNQSTTGSAASLSISGQTGLLTFTGLASANRAKTVRDAADTILELGGSYTPSGTWNWTSATVTWPTFNQNTSGSSASCTGNAATATKWGAYAGISGPTQARTFTLPDADATLLYSGGALGTPVSGILTNCTFPTLNQNTTGSAGSVAYTGVTGMAQGYIPFAGASGLTQDNMLTWNNSTRTLILQGNTPERLWQYHFGDTGAAVINRYRKAQGTMGSPSIVANDEQVTSLIFQGYDGANYITCAQITARIDATPGTNDMPGRLEIYVTPDGSVDPLLAMTIKNNRYIGMGTGNPNRKVEIVDDASNDMVMRLTKAVASQGVLIELVNSIDGKYSYIGANPSTGGIYTQSPDGSGSNPILKVTANGTPRFIITADGVATMGHYGAGTATFDASGNISSSSDLRLKIVKRPFTDGIEALETFVPIVFNWNKESGLDTEHDYIGFPAQDVRKGIPLAVGVDQKGMLTLQDRGILAVLVNVVKSHQAEINALKAALN